VGLRLVDADQGGGDAHGDRSVGARVEAEVAGDVLAAAALESAARRGRRVEAGVDEHAGGAHGEVALHVGVAGDGGGALAVRGPVQGQAAAVVDVVENEVRVVTGEGEAHHRGVVGGRDLGAQP